MLEIFRHREPRLLSLGQAVSNFGDGVATVAFTLLVLDLTHSAVMLSYFAAARMAPLVLFILFGGVIVDRVSRRTLMLLSDASRAVLTGAVVLLLLTHHLHFWHLLVIGALFGFFDAIFMPSFTAIIPEIVPEDLLPAMNATRPLANSLLGGMIGPAVGGVVSAISPTWAIAIDTATFVVSAGALFLMRKTPTPNESSTTSMFSQAKEGMRFAFTTPWFWSTVVAVSFANALVFSQMGVLVPFYLRHVLHASKSTVGFVFAFAGLCGVAASLVAGNLKIPRRRVRAMWIYWLIGDLSAVSFYFATNYWVVLVFPLLAIPGMTIGNVIWESMMQSDVPRDLLGRASSVDWFFSLGLSPLGLIFGGVLGTAMGPRNYFLVFAIVCAIPAPLIMLSRRINAVDASRIAGVTSTV